MSLTILYRLSFLNVGAFFKNVGNGIVSNGYVHDGKNGLSTVKIVLSYTEFVAAGQINTLSGTRRHRSV